MKTFISWSGERSHLLGKAIHQWLPMVLHYAEPWLSQSDIAAGDRWANEVAKELESSRFGIICITRENISSPWILFEAGALAKFMQEGRVIPLLLDIEFKDISGPLAQFQAKKVEREGILEVVTSINQFSDNKLPEPRLTNLFDALWSKLEEAINAIPSGGALAKQPRPQQEILEDVVTTVRGLDARVRDMYDSGPPRGRKRRRFNPMMLDEISHGIGLRRNDPLKLLLLLSYLKDDFPWLYELGLEVYKTANSPSSPKGLKARAQFIEAFKLLRRGPYMDMLATDEESYLFMRDITHMVEDALFNEDHALEDARPRKKNQPAT